MGRERRPVPPLVGRPGSTEARRIRDRRTFALPQARGPVDPLSRSNHDGSRLTVAGPLQRGRNLGQQLLEPVNDVLLVVSEVSHERFDGLTDQEQLFASEVNRVHGSTSYVRGSRHGHDCGPGPPDGLQHHLNGWAGLSQPVKSSGFGVRGPDGAPPAATGRDRPRPAPPHNCAAACADISIHPRSPLMVTVRVYMEGESVHPGDALAKVRHERVHGNGRGRAAGRQWLEMAIGVVTRHRPMDRLAGVAEPDLDGGSGCRRTCGGRSARTTSGRLSGPPHPLRHARHVTLRQAHRVSHHGGREQPRVP